MQQRRDVVRAVLAGIKSRCGTDKRGSEVGRPQNARFDISDVSGVVDARAEDVRPGRSKKIVIQTAQRRLGLIVSAIFVDLKFDRIHRGAIGIKAASGNSVPIKIVRIRHPGRNKAAPGKPSHCGGITIPAGSFCAHWKNTALSNAAVVVADAVNLRNIHVVIPGFRNDDKTIGQSGNRRRSIAAPGNARVHSTAGAHLGHDLIRVSICPRDGITAIAQRGDVGTVAARVGDAYFASDRRAVQRAELLQFDIAGVVRTPDDHKRTVGQGGDPGFPLIARRGGVGDFLRADRAVGFHNSKCDIGVCAAGLIGDNESSGIQRSHVRHGFADGAAAAADQKFAPDFRSGGRKFLAMNAVVVGGRFILAGGFPDDHEVTIAEFGGGRSALIVARVGVYRKIAAEIQVLGRSRNYRQSKLLADALTGNRHARGVGLIQIIIPHGHGGGLANRRHGSRTDQEVRGVAGIRVGGESEQIRHGLVFNFPIAIPRVARVFRMKNADASTGAGSRKNVSPVQRDAGRRIVGANIAARRSRTGRAIKRPGRSVLVQRRRVRGSSIHEAPQVCRIADIGRRGAERVGVPTGAVIGAVFEMAARHYPVETRNVVITH